jgi:hypothetical protein
MNENIRSSEDEKRFAEAESHLPTDDELLKTQFWPNVDGIVYPNSEDIVSKRALELTSGIFLFAEKVNQPEPKKKNNI